MIIIGTFEHSLELELLLANVEQNCIDKKYIKVVPMDIDPANPFWLENKKNQYRYKGIETGMACATGFSIIGASAGFVLAWGPIIWGLIAAGIGFLIGFGTYYFVKKLYLYRSVPHRLPEIIVLVQCQEDEQYRIIRDLMWKYSALTVGKIT